MSATILIADDDRAIRTVLEQALVRLGYDVRATGNAATLWRWVADGQGDLVITDVVMPDENGLDLIPRIRKIRPDLRIIVMSAQNTLLTAVKATERGAFEYLPKPFDLNELIGVVRRALTEPRPSVEEELDRDEVEDQLPLIGRSAAMQEIYRVLARLMGTDLTVMITGESGTGKELVARALHDYGKRRNGPFVAVNMAAIPRELIESELFGHEKGSFTGAAQRSSGRFEQAEGGTLFLDEIGDMPLEAQTRLLRVLQSGEYMTVGGRTPIRANVRIIAATHRDLRRRTASARICSTGSTWCRSACRPCASGPRISRPLCAISWAKPRPKGCRPSGWIPRRWNGCAPIAGPATSGSWRTWCGGSPPSIPRKSSAWTRSRPNSPRPCRRSAPPESSRRIRWAPRSSGICAITSGPIKTPCPRPGSMDASSRKSSVR